MKRLLIAAAILVVLAAGGGGAAWWKLSRHGDPFANARLAMERGDLRAAQIELRNVVREDPANAEAHYRLGAVQMRLADPVAAEKEFRAARDNGFDPRLTAPAMAQAYMAQSKFREVLRDFPPDPKAPDQGAAIMVVRGMALLQLNELDAAGAQIAEAEAASPQSMEPPMAAARVLVAKRDFVAAEAKVDRALALNGKYADALLLKAQLLNLKGDRTRAMAAMDSAVEAAPGLVAARLERANTLVSTGNDARAKEDVDAVLAIEPRSAGATYLRGVLQTRAKDYTNADVSLTKIAGLLPRFPRGLYFQAIVKFNLGQAEQAADAANKYVARNPSDLDGVKLMARIDLATQHTDHAIEVLSKAAAAGSADAEMLDLLGRSYAQGGRQQQALQNFEKAAALAPDNADILTRLASARLGLGDASGAARDLEHSLTLEPKKADAGEALVVASLAAGDVDRAVTALAAIDPASTPKDRLAVLTGMVRLAQLDLAGARTAFTDAVRIAPQSLPARLNLAKVAVLQGRKDEAEQILGDILKQDPSNEQALSGLLSMLLEDGRSGRAVALVEAARSAAPNNPNLTYTLIDLYLRTREPRKAMDLVEAGEKAGLSGPAMNTAKLRTQQALGMTKEVRETLEDAVRRNPADVLARRLLVDALVSANDPDAARAVLRDGLKRSPGDAGLVQTLVGVELKTGGPDGAIRVVDELAKDPANKTALVGLRGDIYMTAQRFANAASAYAAERKADPDSGPLAIREANALSADRRPDPARALLAERIKAHPDDIDAMQAMVSLELGLRRLPAAEAVLQRVLERQPNNVVALNNLAWIYQQRNDPAARSMARKAYLLSPSPQIADTLGWILTSQGEANTALPLLRQAGSQLAGDPTVQYHLGVTLKAVGRPDEAISVLRPLVTGRAEFDDRAAAQTLFDELTAKK